jgi:FdhE protein
MTSDAWVARHPYLQPIADVRTVVDIAAARVTRPVLPVRDWQEYAGDFHVGIPLLQSECAAPDVADPPSVVRGMLDGLMTMPLPGWLADQCRALHANLQAPLDSENGLTEQTPAGDWLPTLPALFRCLLWAVLARDLEPVVTAFGQWRDEERWLRNYCPTCGAAPAMAQLAGRNEGRLRLLSCGCCGTRWRYRRTGCPFCEHVDDHRLLVVAVHGENGLRIDYCESCLGYLKTYDGEGNEGVLLADWTSLHLDLLARDRGLRRLAASLYEV